MNRGDMETNSDIKDAALLPGLEAASKICNESRSRFASSGGWAGANECYINIRAEIMRIQQGKA